MVGYCLKRYVSCPLFKDFSINTKAIVTCKGHEICIFPRIATELSPMTYSLCLLFQTFCLQGGHPGMNHKCCQRGNDLVTGRITVCCQQLIIVFFYLLGYIELHLRQIFASRGFNIGIYYTSHMEHHIIIAWVAVVSMTIPVAWTEMNLYVSHP